MQITQSEAREIIVDLELKGMLNEELTQRLKDCVREYRLDVEIPSFGSRRNLRRTYTCPFYSPGPMGCAISPERKPHGCLAFNPQLPKAQGLRDGCSSNQHLLAEIFPEVPKNEKWPIPLALLKILT